MNSSLTKLSLCSAGYKVPCTWSVLNLSISCDCASEFSGRFLVLCALATVTHPNMNMVHVHVCVIAGIDCMLIIMSCVYGVFVVVFLNCAIWSRVCKHRRAQSRYTSLQRESSVNSAQSTNLPQNTEASKTLWEQASCWEKLGARIERALQRVFAKWGTFCAKWPFVVIVFGLLACAAMIAGIVNFSVITDPVDLWSSPQSRARQEKQYFDDNFTSVNFSVLPTIIV